MNRSLKNADRRILKQSAGFTLIEVLAVLAVIAILIVLLLPARRDSRGASRRVACKNNLKQIGIALYNYREDHGTLPPAYTMDANGKPLHSWRTLILPYLDEQALYDRIDLTKPWNDPANAAVYQVNLPFYQCPTPDLPANHTTYLGLVGVNCYFHPHRGRQLSELKDGPSETAAVIEAAPKHAVHWMAPQDADGRYLLELPEEPPLPHQGGTHLLLADGSVRYISPEVSPGSRLALSTIAGQDKVSE